jgi:hypothetical protein
MESPSKLCELKALDKGLSKKCRSRKIDSMFSDNGTKMLSHDLYLPKAQGKWMHDWRNKG